MSTQDKHTETVLPTDSQEGAASAESKAAGQQPESAYPPGLEPELEGEELEAARRKEVRYTWLLRFELLAFILFIIAILAIVFLD